MLIKITKGTYGHWDGKMVVAKTAKDEPFELDDEKAKRLVDLGVAIYAEEKMEEDVEEQTLEDMTVAQLKKLADDRGITYERTVRKAELIAMIEEQIEETEDEAPAFDAAEAVV